MVETELARALLEKLEISVFQETLPWLGGDLQTLRDTFVDENLYLENSETIKIEVPSRKEKKFDKEYLKAFLNRPLKYSSINGMVLILHGLGGSSRRRGLRRMASCLLKAGFCVLRLNLRGADPGRELASGTYSASCNSDIFPAIEKARRICEALSAERKALIPLFGVGLSLGGTILLNACLGFRTVSKRRKALDGLVCISSPLDLAACSRCIERPRNKFYQIWLLNRLVRQTLEDPFGVTDLEKKLLKKGGLKNISSVSSIRDFDSVITSPRWGFKDVDDYYKKASPIYDLYSDTIEYLPQTLFVHSLDDPWVPASALESLYKSIKLRKLHSKIEICLTKKGGHNGFHGRDGCWGDEISKRWLLKL